MLFYIYAVRTTVQANQENVQADKGKVNARFRQAKPAGNGTGAALEREEAKMKVKNKKQDQ